MTEKKIPDVLKTKNCSVRWKTSPKEYRCYYGVFGTTNGRFDAVTCDSKILPPYCPKRLEKHLKLKTTAEDVLDLGGYLLEQWFAEIDQAKAQLKEYASIKTVRERYTDSDEDLLRIEEIVREIIIKQGQIKALRQLYDKIEKHEEMCYT